MTIKGKRIPGIESTTLHYICVAMQGGKVVKSKEWLSVALMVLAFVANFILKINVMYIILVCAIIGIIRVLWQNKKAKGAAK